MTISFLRRLCVAMLACVASLSAAETPLRLTARTARATYEQFALREGELVALTPAGAQRLPPRTEWRLEGDLEANANLIALTPNYRLARERRVPKRNNGQEVTYEADVTLDYAIGLDRPAWDSQKVGGSIVVCAWVFECACVQVVAVAAPDSMITAQRVARARFILPERLAAGFPVLLVLKDGKFLPARPRFAEEPVNAAMAAFHFGDPVRAAKLLEGTNVRKVVGIHAITPLHLVAESGLGDAVTALLKAGGRFDIPAHDDTYVLDWAALKGRTAAIALLLEAGAKPNRVSTGPAPLANALWCGHDEAAATLVRGGAKIDTLVFGDSAPMMALAQGLPSATREIARRGGFKGRKREIDELLVAAVRAGDTQLATLAIECGADVRQRVDGNPLLVVAVQHDSPELIAALLAGGADAKVTAKEGATPLLAAVQTGNVSLVEALLRTPAAVDTPDRAGQTPLLAAAARGEAAMVNALLAAGARTDRTDAEGRSALALALRTQTAEAVVALAKAGARLQPRANDFSELLADAIICDVPDVLAGAEEAGWKPQTPPARDISAFGLAQFMKSEACLAWLAARGHTTGTAMPLQLPGDVAPKLAAGGSSKDPRVRDGLYPAHQVVVSGVIGADGRLGFVRVQSRVPLLRIATLEALRGWTFQPAMRAGQPVAVAASFPVNFPALDRKIYAMDEVERRAKVVREGSVLETVREFLERGQPFLIGGTRVSFVVEKDGLVSDVFMPANSEFAFGEPLRRALRDYRFEPAQRGGAPVRSWVDTSMAFDVKRGKTLFPGIGTGTDRSPETDF